MKVTIKFGSPDTRLIRRVRKWGDPIIVELLSATTAGLNPPSNFQVIKTCTLGDNGRPFFNDIARFQVVDYNYLKSLQYPSDGFTVDQKMNWLVNHEYDESGIISRPYWIAKGQCRFGPLVFGGQLVQIDPQPITVTGRYPGHDRSELMIIHRLIGVRHSEFGKYTYATHPHYIQHATEAYRAGGVDDVYNEYPRGEIFHPVWSDIDFPANYGDGKLYIPAAFLE